MGTISHLPRKDRPQPARLATEQAAEAALDLLLEAWSRSAEQGLAQRREALKLSGLTAITLSAEAGGLDCANRLVARVVSGIQNDDAVAADALHRHFVLLEQFRAAGDERFYRQLADQVLSGDLFFRETEPASGLLQVRAEEFQTIASGHLLLAQSALWADWLWLPGRNETADLPLEGGALIPLRSGTYETRFGWSGQPHLAATYHDVSVAHGIWGIRTRLGDTHCALDHLLEASRTGARLGTVRGEEPLGAGALRLDIALSALDALIGEAAARLDQAQVSALPDAPDDAARTCLKAALFAAEIGGDEARLERLAAERAEWVLAKTWR